MTRTNNVWESLSASLLVGLLLAMSGCGKDPAVNGPATATNSATPNGKPAAPELEVNDESEPTAIELFKDASPPPKIAPVEVANGVSLKPWTVTAGNMVVTPDGKTAFIGDNDGVDEKKDPHLLGIDVTTKKKIHDWPTKGGELKNLYLSPDGKRLAFWRKNAPGTVFVWDIAQGKQISKFQHPIGKAPESWNDIDDVVFSPDGKTTISANHVNDKNGNQNYFCWTVDNGKKLWQVPTRFSGRPSFSKNGKEVLLWKDKGPAIVDAANGKVLETFLTTDYGSVSNQTAFSPDEQAIFIHATQDVNEQERWQSYLVKIDRKSGKRVWCLRTGGKYQSKLIALPDGKHLLLLSDDVNEFLKTDAQIRAVADGALKARWKIDASCTGDDGAMTPDGKFYLADNKVFALPEWK